MSDKDHNQLVLNKIKELLKDAPSNWAELISERMCKSVSSVRQYATGDKGLKSDQHIALLEHLIEVVDERKKKIEKLTA